ncbi:hypothetical protein [Mesorhizobium sp. B4-1-4]|uniref:hypothetical protein n=1 Tax=Mesorhizobium sp. B4-1-4 TaxID=2589888 RepID=UPI0011277D2E|nr:hypothetical protein [Mesorhizobium sp. B4-1-4]UCI32551.1 hypothetical protein FJW03_03590 [Mesorhizobium sp. B4-1-4]
MTETETARLSRTLPDDQRDKLRPFADDIRQRFDSGAKRTVQNAVEIGRLLSEAKDRLRNSDEGWISWVELEFAGRLSMKSVQVYMRIARFVRDWQINVESTFLNVSILAECSMKSADERRVSDVIKATIYGPITLDHAKAILYPEKPIKNKRPEPEPNLDPSPLEPSGEPYLTPLWFKLMVEDVEARLKGMDIYQHLMHVAQSKGVRLTLSAPGNPEYELLMPDNPKEPHDPDAPDWARVKRDKVKSVGDGFPLSFNPTN